MSFSAPGKIAAPPPRLLGRLLGNPAAVASILVAVFAIAPFLVSGYHIFQLTQLVIYALALLGLNLLTGLSGQVSLGHGAFYALGAYLTTICMSRWGVPYWLTPIPCGAVCFGVGFLFGRPAARLEGLYLALATFALAIAMPQFLKLDKLEPWTGGSQGVPVQKPSSPLPDHINDDRWLYLFCLAVAALLFAAVWNVARGRTGRALIALRDHPIAASAMGIDTTAYKSTTFGVSAMVTGVAGGLGGMLAGYISPDSFSIFLSIQFLVGSVVGGIASIFGTLFGAAFIALVPDFASKISDAAPWALYGVLLIAVMMLMPAGVAGLVRSARARLARRRASSPSSSASPDAPNAK
jgi:branched-chain amino acid transport system permease protein